MRASAKKVKCLRVVLSHMVVKQHLDFPTCILGLRVVLSHMVVKPEVEQAETKLRLRVVLSHMVVKLLPCR